MSEQVKKTFVKEPAENHDFSIGTEHVRGQVVAGADVEKYLKAKETITAKDHADFEIYLNEKKQRDLLQPVTSQPPSRLDRRTILKVVTGTAVAGEAAALGYGWIKSGGETGQAVQAGGRVSTAPQSQHIVRELVDSKADVGGRSLGRWILLLPTKLGGGTYAIDLNSNRVLASIWY
jgi:hypothetical protein